LRTELRLLADSTGLHDATPWVVLDADRQRVRQGTGLADLPAADGVLVIVPDEWITVLPVALPRMATRQIQEVLPAAVEDRLMAPVESVDLVLLKHRPDGVSLVAAWSLDWRDALLRTPALINVSALSVVAESAGLPLAHGEVGLMLADGRCVLRLADGSVCADQVSGDDAPPLVSLALRETSGPVRVFSVPESTAGWPSWVGALGERITSRSPYDWRTAEFPARSSLYQRRRRRLDAAAAVHALRVPALIAAAWLSFELIAGLVGWAVLRSELAMIQSRQEQAFRDVFGPSAALVDGELQLRRKFTASQAGTGDATAHDFLAMMTRLANDYPVEANLAGSVAGAAAPLSVSEIHYDSGQLTLRLRDADTGQRWRQAARAAGFSAHLDVADGATLVRITP